MSEAEWAHGRCENFSQPHSPCMGISRISVGDWALPHSQTDPAEKVLINAHPPCPPSRVSNKCSGHLLWHLWYKRHFLNSGSDLNIEQKLWKYHSIYYYKTDVMKNYDGYVLSLWSTVFVHSHVHAQIHAHPSFSTVFHVFFVFSCTLVLTKCGITQTIPSSQAAKCLYCIHGWQEQWITKVW